MGGYGQPEARKRRWLLFWWLGVYPLSPGVCAPNTGAFLRLNEPGVNRGFGVFGGAKAGFPLFGDGCPGRSALLKTSFFLYAFDGFFVWRIWGSVILQ